MNKKGKNKKGKISNQTSIQTEKASDKIEETVPTNKDIVEKTCELIKNVEVKAGSTREITTPDNKNEVVLLSTSTNVEETPKKPKRNKGKKHIDKEDECDINSEKDSNKNDTLSTIVSKAFDIELQEDTKIDTPVVRKKKNKKQNDKQKDNDVVLDNREQVSSLEIVTSIVKESELTQETKYDQQNLAEKLIEEEGVDQEIVKQVVKKKNKKKKKNDCEKSIKEDISCTSAFQTLLDVKNEPFETTTLHEKKSDTMCLERTKSEMEILPQDNLLLEEKTKTKEITISNEPSCVKSEVERKITITEGKNKDKKGKKSALKCEQDVVFSEKCLLETSLVTDEKETMVKNINEQVDAKASEETITKNKAKIVKPVGKKHIEHQVNIESQRDSIIHGVEANEEQNSESTEENKYAKDSQNELVNFSILTDITSHQSKELEQSELELLNVPIKTTSKKRKKGLKIPRAPDLSFDMLETKTDSSLLFNQATDINVGSSESNQDTPIDFTPLESETFVQVSSVDEIILFTESSKEKDELKRKTNMSSKQRSVLEDKIKSDSEISSTSQIELIPNQSMIMPPSDLKHENSPSSEISKKVDEMRIEAPSMEMHTIEEISLKSKETERFDCNTIPDIIYLDSSSQQLSDDNNNNATAAGRFSGQHVIIPTQQCTEIPKGDFHVRQEKESNLLKADKTDLKSKMIEVNQDMEELRLSIERSLAELNVIEKKDEVLEKQFEKSGDSKQHKTEIKTNTEDDEQKNLIAISDVENSTVAHSEELPCLRKTPESNSNKNTKLILSKDHEQMNLAKLDKNLSNIKKNNDKFDSKVLEIYPEESKILTTITDFNVSNKTSTTIAEKLTETLLKFDTKGYTKPVIKNDETESCDDRICSILESKDGATKSNETETESISPPVCPSRKDHKNKHRKRKGKQDIPITVVQSHESTQSITSVTASSSSGSQENKKEDKNNQKKDNNNESKGKSKQQASNTDAILEEELVTNTAYEPIENFEDALTSSVEDVNQSFEMIIKDSQQQLSLKNNTSTINDEKSSITLPKNLLGHPDIPARSSKRDYKKEKDKIPNEISAKVKIKDSIEVEKKLSKNTQTINILKDLKYYKVSDNEEFVYKYNFRKVFLQNICHICRKVLNGVRLACCYCNLVFYCGIKHKDEDWPQHQALCFAVSTIGHLRGQKHIYADAKNITGHDYRMIRMQVIVSCEKILKRRLVPWEQEALLYPRICADVSCREWRQIKLSDCQGCGQISFCTENPDHYPKSHSRWCKSYNLYQKLVSYQQSKGRLEPKLPTKVMTEKYEIPDKINEVLAEMYEEKIDMNDIQYAALTQLATAPLTAAYCHQLCKNKGNTAKDYKKSFNIHVVGAELQFEADALNKWEVFFLHLLPDIQELKVVLINSNLNPSKLPLSLLGKMKVCENCRQKKRSVVFNFQETCYGDYKSSEYFEHPDIACAFNPGIQRSTIYNGKDPWPSTVNIIIKQKVPFLITAYTMEELQKDCMRIKESVDVDYNIICEPKCNHFASVRPDRNFISDDETPLLFKNCCFAIICG